MNRIKLIVITVLTCLIVISACKKDEDSPSMSAKVNGGSWTALTQIAKLQDNNYIVTGTSSSGVVIAVTIKGITEGTYNFGASMDSVNAECVAVYQPDITSPTENNFFSKSGTVKLSEINSKKEEISGTFSFEVMNLDSTLSITEGEFTNVGY